MKINLYKVFEDIEERNLKPIEVEINGRMAYYSELFYGEDGGKESGFFEFSKRFFTYEYDNSYEKEFQQLRLNYRFEILLATDENHDDGSSIGGIVGYTHLGLLERFKLNWTFQKTWFQKPENLKWLVSIPISILTAYITTNLTK